MTSTLLHPKTETYDSSSKTERTSLSVGASVGADVVGDTLGDKEGDLDGEVVGYFASKIQNGGTT